MAMAKLEKLHPSSVFKGPFSADSIFLRSSSSLSSPNEQTKGQTKGQTLIVSMFHDQALPWFKLKHGHQGVNITLGLPFLRLSVAHGTAFDLYGKNQANYLGCHEVLKRAIKTHKKIMGVMGVNEYQ